MMRVVYPGSFDPITNGHLDVIERCSRMFEEVRVLISFNSAKNYLFSTEERYELVRKSVEGIPNVTVGINYGLLVNYMIKRELYTIIKGLRAVSDYEYEMQMAYANRGMYDGIDTLFIPTSQKYSYLSSSVVKEIARHGGPFGHLVPYQIFDKIKAKFEDK